MHYLVAYGHVIRCEKAKDPNEAAKFAFGIVDNDRITAVECDKLPRRMKRSTLMNLERKLAKRHFMRTGSVIAGYEKEPGIKNVHWTQCQLCRILITTEPMDKGVEEVCCQVCQLKLDGITQQEANDLSIAKIRETLNISIHHSPMCTRE